MGFLDGLMEVADILKDIVLLPVEVEKAAKELGEDVKEAVIQDIGHRVSGTPDKPIRTSYTIKDDAQALVDKSWEKYDRAKQNYDTAWSSMAENAEKLQKIRADVYASLGQAIHSKKLPKLPVSSVTVWVPPEIPSIDKFTFDLGTQLSSISLRKEAAEEFSIQAETYRDDVNSAVNKINQMKRFVINVSHSQEEEFEMLSYIKKAYRQKSEATLIESADLLHEIAQLCFQEVSRHTNETYKQLLEKQKKLWT